MKCFKSTAAICREIESSQGLFKYNKERLTLRDPKSKPFHGMTETEINHFLVSLIERVDLHVHRTIAPGSPGSRSSKFPTFVVGDSHSARDFMIVFGYAHSAAEEIQVTELARELHRIVEREGCARIWNGRSFVETNGIIRRGGSREKTDAIMHLDGEHRISISLKNLATGKANEMQGWSGVQGFRGERPILDFADAAHASSSPRCWRRIDDDLIRRTACWGSDDDQVDVIVAGGGLSLEPIDIGYRIAASALGGIWYRCDGEIPDGDFEPVLFCRPSSKHFLVTSAGQVPGTRMMVAPVAHARASSRSIEI